MWHASETVRQADRHLPPSIPAGDTDCVCVCCCFRLSPESPGRVCTSWQRRVPSGVDVDALLGALPPSFSLSSRHSTLTFQKMQRKCYAQFALDVSHLGMVNRLAPFKFKGMTVMAESVGATPTL